MQAAATSVTTACCSPQNAIKMTHGLSRGKYYFALFSKKNSPGVASCDEIGGRELYSPQKNVRAQKMQAAATNVTTACCSPQNAFRMAHALEGHKYYFYLFCDKIVTEPKHGRFDRKFSRI